MMHRVALWDLMDRCLARDPPSLPQNAEASAESINSWTFFIRHIALQRRGRLLYLPSGTMSDAGQWDGCALTLATIETGPSTGFTSTLYPSSWISGKSPCKSCVAASMATVEDSPGTSEI